MFSDLGFYILFIFKLLMIGVLSLIISYIYRKNTNPETLREYTLLSLIITAFISIMNNYSLDDNHILINPIILPLSVLSVFIVLSAFLFNQKNSKSTFIKLFLSFSISICVGLGYYLSSVSLIAILFLIDYFLDGVFVFFSDQENDSLLNEEIDSIDLIDEDIEVIDKE